MDAPKPNLERPVFLDESGARFRRMQRLGALVVAGAVLLAILFAATVFRAPTLSKAPLTPHASDRFPPRVGSIKAERRLFASIVRDEAIRNRVKAPAGAPAQIMGAYFAPWEPDAFVAFRAHASELTHVYPAWLQLTADGGAVSSEDWTPGSNKGTGQLTTAARAAGVKIVPVVGNAANETFDRVRLTALAQSPAKQQAVLKALTDFVERNRYDGLQIDFELWSPAEIHALAPWLKRLREALTRQNKELSVTLEDELSRDDMRLLASVCDYVVIMAYDEHSDADEPGPIASPGFIDRTLKKAAAVVPAEKLVLGVGAFGYDWPLDKTGATATSITNAEALALAEGYRDGEDPTKVIDFDDQDQEATFGYDDDEGKKHEVWFLDAASVANAMTLGRAYHVRGAALWALGEEDPSSWQAFGLKAQPNPDLSKLTTAQAVQFTGDGEFLRVVSPPQAGKRTVERDPRTGLITDEAYTAYASGWLLRRSGNPPKTLALTFDDGPDPTWTPKILDILKRHNVKATFFMIGQQAAAHPEIVRRVLRDGHEIGNHSFTHPNMAHVREDRVRLELAAAERALESIVGRQITLFRPPYNADTEPDSYGEIMPVAVASKLGYVTAGESIDPMDWDTERKAADGSVHRLTAAEIVASTLAQIDKGHAILLHDAGGDRAATVAALEPLIETLQQRGYKLVTMGELEGRGLDATMPPLPAKERTSILVDKISFAIGLIFQRALFWAFTVAIVLGLLRISLMIALAARHRPVRPEWTDPEPPKVDVLVAAYNEAPVIVRTLESLLASEKVTVHIIVVDDGSTDGTADVVREHFGGDPRVELYGKPNGGKASALNLALSHATAPVVVGVDADTQLPHDALEELADWFVDPTIGAVAGHVQVGNKKGLVTRWQSIEYTTSQNIDRRALARLNAITVVPGAIGAWRRQALEEVGGYQSDTLAEDMDLTWRVRIAGWRIASEPCALAYTEAPETISALLRQRFRWTYGTLQCLWKHRSALFKHGWFGRFSLPTLWLFQIVGQLLAPLIDLQILLAALSRVGHWLAQREHADAAQAPDGTLWLMLAIYLAFIALELAAGWIAYGLEGLSRRELWLLPTQRLVYRQIMYIVVWRAISRAFGGLSQGWGKLRRTGSVSMARKS